jgi:acyl-CoA dehydrogenase
MHDVSTLLLDSVQRLLSDLSERRVALLSDVEQLAAGWLEIERMGLPLALVPEDCGGLGLEEPLGLALVHICGRHAVPYLIVDTMLSNRFAAESGRDPVTSEVGSLGQLSAAQQEFAALARAMQMAGALEAILTLTLAHVESRNQFGRPIAQFQAVQHSLAVMVGEVAAANAAAEHAVGKIRAGGAPLTLAVGIARARVGEAGARVTGLAHQLHGAIGYTAEHRLHLYTTAIWKWRDEFGTQAWWTKRVGQTVLTEGQDDFWSMVTQA